MSKYNGETAAAYIRVSTDNQDLSQDLQFEAANSYAAHKGLVVSPALVIRDPDVSGSTEFKSRDGGAMIMELVRDGTIKHLIIYKLDRLGRDAIDIQMTFKELTEKLGCVVHILDLGGGDSFASDNPFTKFLVGLMALYAELELNTIRSRIKCAATEKRRQGLAWGKIPFGKRGVPTGKTNKSGGPEQRLEDNPEEMECLKKMIELRTSGGENGTPLGYGEVGRKLEELGFKPGALRTRKSAGSKKKSAAWSRATIYRILVGQTAHSLGHDEASIQAKLKAEGAARFEAANANNTPDSGSN